MSRVASTFAQLAPGTQPDELSILAVSDIRSQPLDDLFHHLAELTSQPDLIVYAGDDVARFQPPGGPNHFEALASSSRYGLVAVAGNDDGPNAWRFIHGKGVHEVHRTPVLIGDVLVVGLEGAPRRPGIPAIGAPLYTEPEIASHLSQALALSSTGPVFVVSHAPPHKVLDRAQRFGDHNIGSRALRDAVLQDSRIQVVICGHCHREGGQTKQLGRAVVINAASHDGPDDFIRVALYEWRRTCTGSPRFNFAYPWGELMCLHGMYRTDFLKLWKAGITRLEGLAAISAEALSAIVGRSSEAVRCFPLLASARLTSRPLPMAPLYAPPAPRVYFDIETDPYGGDKLCWLIGILDEANGDFRQFHSRRERRLLKEFADYCASLDHRSLVSYSGSNFDHRNVIHRMKALRIAVPSVIECAVDLLYPVRRALAVPHASYGLKSVAESLGFSYRHPDLGGFTVGLEGYKLATGQKPITRQLLEYNEDDVRSLQHVVSRVQALCGYGGPPRPRKHKLSGGARRRLGKS